MLQGFREFMLKQNFLALALAVVIGTAIGKVVTAIVSNVIMPLVGVALPASSWRTFRVVLQRSTVDGETVENALLLGDLLGAFVDFLIIALVVYLIAKALIKSPPPPETQSCPQCTETIPVNARRCKYCTSDVAAVAARV
ncbi:MAG: MscL family protein [Gemmatimonadetes bacterium]|nr:MscL family protein [Gemmatimonadota bacterium]